ncbi:MAG: flagellar biosynthetic protein FliO [Alphaproteobacteria bacterium]|jgi:flagellar protein FliO/FliZ|nr:flagellar biosynthetic protein FliO [Alphaproteobacteria bacterium]MDP6518195.1 flagellar biosynthetic protein FliO [Alphaproteobacteria bacterium]
MDYRTYLWALIVLLMVLGLIAVMAWLVRRLGLSPGTVGLGRGGRRLQLVEMTPLDAKHRLALIRRDDVHHLVLLGANTTTVVESGIRVASSEAAPPAGEGS